MRKEHTVSEVTDAEGLTDAQFFYGEIKKLQSECDKLKLLNNKLLEESEKSDQRYHETLDREHRFCDALKIIKDYTEGMSIDKKVTKKEIVSELEDITLAIGIFADHWRRNNPDLDFAAIMNHLAERRFENDSTNS